VLPLTRSCEAVAGLKRSDYGVRYCDPNQNPFAGFKLAIQYYRTAICDFRGIVSKNWPKKLKSAYAMP
jgi:hypothetical protein